MERGFFVFPSFFLFKVIAHAHAGTHYCVALCHVNCRCCAVAQTVVVLCCKATRLLPGLVELRVMLCRVASSDRSRSG